MPKALKVLADPVWEEPTGGAAGAPALLRDKEAGMTEGDIVGVIDDDESVRLSVCLLVETLGVETRGYASGKAFLADPHAAECGCIVADVRMPGLSGLQLQAKLVERKLQVPIVFVTGHGDVPMAVQAMRGGAVDFLLKPFNDQLLLDRVQQALDLGRSMRREVGLRRAIELRLAKLSQREHDVLRLVVAGKMSKEVAFELGISPRTVESHRASIMQKMEVDSLAELVRLVAIAGKAGRPAP